MPRIGAGGRGGFVVLEAMPALVDDGVLLVDLMAGKHVREQSPAFRAAPVFFENKKGQGICL